MESHSIGMLQAQYYRKAIDAYHENNLKLSLIYLKKLDNWNAESVDLLVNSAYNLWRERIVESENGFVNNDEEAAIAVQEAFTLLLSGNVSHDSIQPWNYVRLSYLYLVEGNLDGALEIMNIASNRGHLEDILIVTQTCYILWAMDNAQEVKRVMTFLRSALFDLSASLKANVETSYAIAGGLLPLSTLFLLCATYLQHEAKAIKAKKAKSKMMKEFHDLLHEAYFYEFFVYASDFTQIMVWYDSSITWLQKTEALDSSPLLLLAQALNYESFTRNSLSNVEIGKMIGCMRRYKRDEDVPRIMSNALVINSWNVFCRDTMKECELKYVRNPNDRQWTILFDSEEFELTRIQKVFRGYRIRKIWPEFRDRRMAILAHFAEQVYVAKGRYNRYYFNYHCLLWQRWRKYIADWKELKRISSTRLQTRWRVAMNVMRFQAMKLRVRQANEKYLILCQHLFDIKRIQCLRRWQDFYLHRRRHASAAIIADVLFLNGYNQLLVKGMNMVMSILRIRYKYLRKLAYSYWRERFLLREKQHAKFTIRFFVRDQRKKVGEQKVEEALQEIEAVVAQKLEEKNFQKDFTPVKRQFWEIWRKKYEDICNHRALIRAVFTLQRRHRQKKSRLLLLQLRVRREAQYAYLHRRWYLTVISIIQPWRVNAAARKIQRASRCRQARKALRRLQQIFTVMRQRLHEKAIVAKQNIIKRWSKYIFLWHREKLRAVKWIRFACQRLLLRSRLKRIHRRKTINYRILDAAHRSFLRGLFVFIRDRIKYETQVLAMKRLVKTLYEIQTKRSLLRLESQCQGQYLLHEIAGRSMESRIDSLFWHGARLSVEIASFRASRASMTFSSATTNIIFPWERRVYSDKVLLSLHSMKKVKAFRTWMAMYRRRQRFNHQGAFLVAHEHFIHLLDTIYKRAKANVQIQSLFRKAIARRKLTSLQILHRHGAELQRRREINLVHLSFVRMQILMEKQRKSLPKIVNSFRRLHAIRKVENLRLRREQYEYAEEVINSSKFHRSLMTAIMKQWLLLYADRVLRLDLDEDEFIMRRLVHRTHMKQYRNSNNQSLYHSSDDNYIDLESEQNEFDQMDFSSSASSLRQKKMERYEQRQQLVEMKLSRQKQKLRNAKLQQSISRFPSSVALFFRSEKFHTYWHQVKTQQIFYLNHSTVKQLQEQEIYFILQFTSTVVLQDLTAKIMQMVCNAFKGVKLIITSSSDNYDLIDEEIVQKYLVDLLTDRSLYEFVVIDRSKWPLTLLPMNNQQQQQQLQPNERQQLSVLIEQTRFTYHALVLLFRALAFHSQRVNIRNESLLENNQIRILTQLTVDVESFGWFGILLMCMALTSYPHLKSFTLRLSNNFSSSNLQCSSGSIIIPEYMVIALDALSKFPSLSNLRIVGIIPREWLQKLTTYLEDSERFIKLERMELLILEADQNLARALTDRAKMRCYSSLQQGLSVYIDEVSAA